MRQTLDWKVADAILRLEEGEEMAQAREESSGFFRYCEEDCFKLWRLILLALFVLGC